MPHSARMRGTFLASSGGARKKVAILPSGGYYNLGANKPSPTFSLAIFLTRYSHANCEGRRVRTHGCFFFFSQRGGRISISSRLLTPKKSALVPFSTFFMAQISGDIDPNRAFAISAIGQGAKRAWRGSRDQDLVWQQFCSRKDQTSFGAPRSVLRALRIHLLRLRPTWRLSGGLSATIRLTPVSSIPRTIARVRCDQPRSSNNAASSCPGVRKSLFSNCHRPYNSIFAQKKRKLANLCLTFKHNKVTVWSP